jgi:acetylornithine deacetylase/succinyl-diaminopimelate desuccinylase-like protein
LLEIASSDITKFVDQDRVVKLAMDLTNIESPTGKEQEVADLYASKLRSLGMKVTLQEVENGRPNGLALLNGEGSGHGATLMFNGHLDTSFAPSDDPEILKAISPVYRFESPWCRREGEWIYGLGVFNMKAALAAYAESVHAIQDSGVKLKGDIVIAGVVGEIEKTQVDKYRGPQYRGYGTGTAYLVSHGGTADMAILGEPTGLRLMLSHSGSIWVKVSLKGALVHTGHSMGMANVITQMSKVISAFEEWIPSYQRKYEFKGVKPMVSIGSIEGGWPWRASRTPGFCNLFLDVRFPPPYHALDIKQEICEDVLEKVKHRYGIDPDLDVYVTDEWANVDDDEYIVASVERAHKNVIGEQVQRVYFSWSSDANILTRHGIIAINYGPSGGPGKETRGTQYIPNLVACSKVYALVVRDVCSKERKEVRK